MNYYQNLLPQPRIEQELSSIFKEAAFQTKDRHTIFPLSKSHLPTVVLQYVEMAQLEIDNSKFFVCASGVNSMVHTDSGGRLAALNIPLSLPAFGGKMNWFAESWKATTQYKGTEAWLRMASIIEHEVHDELSAQAASLVSLKLTENAVPTESLFMTCPALVRINEWHNIDNTENQFQRVVFSMRFKGHQSIENLHLRFKEISQL